MKHFHITYPKRIIFYNNQFIQRKFHLEAINSTNDSTAVVDRKNMTFYRLVQHLYFSSYLKLFHRPIRIELLNFYLLDLDCHQNHPLAHDLLDCLEPKILYTYKVRTLKIDRKSTRLNSSHV